MTRVFIGVDVAKAHLDVAANDDANVHRFSNDDGGVAKLAAWLRERPVHLVVMESTGGYEQRLRVALQLAQLPVAHINPVRLRDFARSLGKLAKTDRLDARLLALYGERCRPRVSELQTKEARQLQALVSRRRQLQDMLTQERNRLEFSLPSDIDTELRAHIALLTAALKSNLRSIRSTLQAIAEPAANSLQTVPGVGPVLTAALIALVPELGQLSRTQIAALIGVAPMHRDSGTLQGKRFIAGGRPTVRAILYMAALAALKNNPPIRSLYARLVAKGKPKKVAIVACMRKLLCVLNAIRKSGQAWITPVRPLAEH